MVEIRNAEDLSSWFERAPADWAIAIAARTALRVLPLTFDGADFGYGFPPLIARTFRAGLIASVASIWPGRDIREAAEQALLTIVGGARESAVASRPLQFALLAITEGRGFAIDALIEAEIILNSDNFWDAVNSDVKTLEQKGVHGLWRRPLWPRSFPKEIEEKWSYAKKELHEYGSNWQVWIHWYDDRIEGKPFHEEIEGKWASVPDEDWRQGPAHVNLILQEMWNDFWYELLDDEARSEQPEPSLPSQERRAFQFAPDVEGRIGLAPLSDPGEGLISTDGRQEDYQELLNKARDVLDLGANRLGDLARPIERLLQLPSDIREVRANILWSRMNSLRIALKGHDDAKDVIGDGRRLDGVVADRLRDLVETANVFMLGDPTLLDLDAARPGPTEVVDSKAEVAVLGDEALAQLKSAEFLSEEAREVISEQLDDLKQAPGDLSGRQGAGMARRTVRNVISSVLAAGYKRAKESEIGRGLKDVRSGFYQYIGQKIAEFVGQNYDKLVAYVIEVFQKPELQRILDAIVSGLASLL